MGWNLLDLSKSGGGKRMIKCQNKWWNLTAAVCIALACVVKADDKKKELSTIIGDLRENPINISSIPWQLTNTSQGYPQNNTDVDFKKCLADPFKLKDPTLKFVDVYFRYQPPSQCPIKVSLCSEFESAFLVIYDLTESKELNLKETAVYSCEKATSNSTCTPSIKCRENMTTVIEMDIELSAKHVYVFGLIGFESKSQESQFSLDMRFNNSNQQTPDPPSSHKQPSFRHDRGVVGGLVLAAMIFVIGCIALGSSMWARYKINVAESAELLDHDDEEGMDIQSPLSPSRVATANESEMVWLNGKPPLS